MKILLDTETGDPDDILVIAYLADKGLSAVTMNPGTDEQVGLVKSALRELGLNIPVGGNDIDKNCVSAFYRKIYDYKPEKPDGSCQEIISDQVNQGAKVLTCGLPKNIQNVQLDEWWAQGGFVGDSVMGNNPVLEKFRGLETCQSFNFSNRKIIERCIANSKKQFFVSKNICHGAIFDRTKIAKNPVIKRIMNIYLKEHDGKAFHDLLAAFALINPDKITWEKVDIYYDKNRVGGIVNPNSSTSISVNYDANAFWGSI